jgi:hypothetical protein
LVCNFKCVSFLQAFQIFLLFFFIQILTTNLAKSSQQYLCDGLNAESP